MAGHVTPVGLRMSAVSAALCIVLSCGGGPVSYPLGFYLFSVTPERACADTTVTIRFVASETLEGNPDVTIDGSPATFVSATGLEYTYSYYVTGTESDGVVPVVISGTAVSGKTGQSTYAAIFDFSGPTFAVVYVSHAPGRPGDTQVARFVCSEDLAAPPTATINGVGVVVSPLAARTYQCSWTVSDYGLSGPVSIEMSGVDLVGHVGSSTGALDVEFPVSLLGGGLVDSEYDRQNDRVVAVATGPDRLCVFDPADGSLALVNLAAAPTCVAVSPDGAYAAVGHTSLVTYVDLSAASVVRTIVVTPDVVDIVLPGDGYAYAAGIGQSSPSTKFSCIDMSAGTEALSTVAHYYLQTQMRLHPSGNVIYDCTRRTIDEQIARIRIDSGDLAWEHFGDHDNGGNLWLSEDGRRLITADGKSYLASAEPEEEARLNGTLSRTSAVNWVGHSIAAGDKIVAVPEGAEDTTLQLYDHVTLAFQGIATVPDFYLDGETCAAHGRFVFPRSDGTDWYVVAEADAAATFVGDFGVAVVRTGDFNTSVAGAIPSPTIALAGSTGASRILGWGVTEAEYSPQLERIVAVSGGTADLHIYDPATGTDQSVALNAGPQGVSVAPGGLEAVVKHGSALSRVNLGTASFDGMVPASITHYDDVVAGGNGYAYVFPGGGGWVNVHNIDLSTGTDTLQPSVYCGLKARVHPDGSAIYAADTRSSPGHIHEFDISGDLAMHGAGFPYHGDFVVDGDLWLSEAGHRSYIAAGHSFEISSDPDLYLRYRGTIPGINLLQGLYQSAATGKIALVPEGDGDTEVRLHDATFLELDGTVSLPTFVVNGSAFPGRGRFVFMRTDGSECYVVVRAAEGSGLLDEHAIVTVTPGEFVPPVIPPPSDPPTSIVGACDASDLFGYHVTDVEYSKALDRLVTVSAGPNRLHIYDPAAKIEQTVELPMEPLAVSISPDGHTAAVGHGGYISLIDLDTATWQKALHVDTVVCDVVHAGNGYVYVTSDVTGLGNILSVDIATDIQSWPTTYEVVTRPGLELLYHAALQAIYTPDCTASDTINRCSIVSGTAEFVWGDANGRAYPVGARLWLSEDEGRIFTRGGSVLTAAAAQAADLQYLGALEGMTSAQYVADSTAAAKTLAIPRGAADTELRTFNGATFVLEGTTPFPQFDVQGTQYAGHGRFVFWRSDATACYVVMCADAASGLDADCAVVTLGQ